MATVLGIVITGIFSVITILLQMRQDKIINRIDSQTLFIENENKVKQKLLAAEKKRDSIIQQILILVLNCTVEILHRVDPSNHINPEMTKKSEELQREYANVNREIESLTREYEVVITMASDLQKKIATLQNGNKDGGK